MGRRRPLSPSGTRRRGGSSASLAPTSLPPLVQGPPRCFLRCTVPRVVWTVSKPPAATVSVRLRWWGETSNGTIFEPGCPGKTSARYTVCCGPGRFADYLRDMADLVLDVMTKPHHLPIGRAQITQLAQLSPSNPINGFFPIISPTADKLGELQVSLLLEPLPELYDTCSSAPTTDASLNVSPAQRSSKFVSPSQQPRHKRVTIADRGSVTHSRATTPSRRKDCSLLQENSENIKDPHSASHHHLIFPDELSEANPSKPRAPFPSGIDPEAPARKNMHVLSLHNPAARDLLSALLDQGNKLREAMVMSTMKSSPDMEIELKEVSPLKERNELRAPARSPLLDSNIVPAPGDPRLFTGDQEVSGQHFDLSCEERAIELLLGSTDLSPEHFWDRTGSLLESLSLGSEVYESELNDPHYDQSLLESLFYTTPKSDSSLSDVLSDADVNPSRKGTKREALKKADPVILLKDPNPKATGFKSRPLAPPEDPTESAHVTSLSTARLAVLERIRVARVVIESLKIPPERTPVTLKQRSLMGKPPHPTLGNKCTFFVECHFPVGASQDAKGQVSLSTEVIRVASSKVTDGAVKFHQHFVASVQFSGAMAEHWWSSSLLFTIYMRKSTQKKPMAIGSAALQLRQVIKSELLTVSCEVPVEKEGGQRQIGPLKVSLELAADNKDFARTAARSAVAAPQVPAHAVRSARPECQEPHGMNVSTDSPGGVTLQHRQRSQQAGAASANVRHPATPVARSLMTQVNGSEEEGLLLHLLLMVPDGRDFVADVSGIPSSCNVYLTCKLLSTEEASQSAVVWGTTQPTFNFSQVIPFSLTSKLLERLKNNVMVIEAWNKMGSHGCDRLLGLVKLPLHQFYISFRDPKISHLLLQAQFPVVAVDSYLPVIDVFTGSRSGSLQVILAMGSAEQVLTLQGLKTKAGQVPPVTQRPAHSLDPPPAQLRTLDQAGEDLAQHVFEIRVESVKGLAPLQSTVWGEADCYVQYYFPVQEPQLDEEGVKLKPFRTAATLCIPDPVFNDEHRHCLLVHADDPVQRLLVSAFMAPGVAGGGIQFEVWCRYYYPTVRDQMVAKGTLPVSRLCALVTMQQHEEIGIQTFNLPLIPRTESSEEFHSRSSGLLDVSVRYQQPMRRAAGRAVQAVSLAVQIHRAAGLQAAVSGVAELLVHCDPSRLRNEDLSQMVLREVEVGGLQTPRPSPGAVAQRNPSLQYYAAVGVNAYIAVHLSFLPEAERCSTQPVAGTFCPEFEHHVEFPCNLIVQKSSGGVSSLGELLQSASIIFSIYHQSTRSAPKAPAARTSRDYLLGTVSVPTRDLLGRQSGISGWYPVTLPEDLVPSHHTDIMPAVVGGLQLSVGFAHQDDRRRVLEAAKLLGWVGEEGHEDSLDDSDGWEQSASLVTVTVSTPRVWLPAHCVLLSGQTHIDQSTFCYLRYKLYDQEPSWTWLRRPRLSDDAKNITVSFRKPTQVTLRRSQGLLWFLREEKLEIQVWWAYGRVKAAERPLDTDRLIGSAYVDLAALAEISGTTRSVSGAAVRVRVGLASKTAAALPSRLSWAEDCSSSEGDSTEKDPGESRQASEHPTHEQDVVSPESTRPPQDVGMCLESTVAVSILVERAMHLSLKGSPLTEREVAVPSSCVSFAVAGADAPVTTAVVENTDSPVWDFQREARLSKELLLDPQQTLVFKVWHKAETERVIGFASVDLSPLVSGFQLVCGWYNITDFSGQCRGQLKVAVAPLQNITNLKEERQARGWTQPPSSSLRAAASPRQTSSPGTREVDVPPRERAVPSRAAPLGAWPPRHEEHMQNVRRFHESLQQAEGTVLRAARTGSLSVSSRDSLLTELRQNLRELDEVQRYFSRKMTGSFPDFSCASPGERERDHRGSRSREEDPSGCHLWEQSGQLVSQVSSLITDLQTITKTSKEPSAGHQDSSRQPGPQHGPGQRDGGAGPELGSAREPRQPRSLGRSVFTRQMLRQLLAEGEPPVPTGSIREDEGAAQLHSEEEYEEDVIEPRTLNEVTHITDGTSPWSSLLSEAEQQPLHLGADEQHSLDRASFQRGSSRRSSLFSSLLQGDTLGLPADQSSPWAGAESFQHAETAEEELLQPPRVSDGHREADGPAEGGRWGWDGAFGSKPREQNGEGDGGSEEQPGSAAEVGLADLTAAAEADSDAVNEDLQGGAESGSDEVCCWSRSAQAGSEERGRSPSDGSCAEPEPAVDLSNPAVVLPNFFLPPQQMEASMRLLSKAEPQTALKSRSEAAPVGIPYRRLGRPRPTANLSEEETRRIVRIFSAQLSKDE